MGLQTDFFSFSPFPRGGGGHWSLAVHAILELKTFYQTPKKAKRQKDKKTKKAKRQKGKKAKRQKDKKKGKKAKRQKDKKTKKAKHAKR